VHDHLRPGSRWVRLLPFGDPHARLSRPRRSRRHDRRHHPWQSRPSRHT
jgi:hypothetical protein